MLLAGLQKNSFIDYPGKISCVLFTTGCNFVCPYCHNADLARGEYPQQLGLDEITAFLRSRQGMLQGVVITGGEPTLHSWVVDLCEVIKSLDYPVKLDTNGSRPAVLDRLLQNKLVDFVAMDIKASLEAYDPFCRLPRIQEALSESIRRIMESAPDYEFRTTCVKPIVNEETIGNIAGIIRGARIYALQGYHESEVLHPEFFQDVNPRYDEEEMMALKAVADPWVQECLVR